jgi:hypothetical protein
LAVEAELKVQQQTMDALTDVLELLGEWTKKKTWAS